MCTVEEPNEEFTSRHSLEWKFLFLDHRYSLNFDVHFSPCDSVSASLLSVFLKVWWRLSLYQYNNYNNNNNNYIDGLNKIPPRSNSTLAAGLTNSN